MDLGSIKDVLVIGLGRRTGLAASNFLAGCGCNVTASDVRTEKELKPVIDELDSRVKVIAGGQSPEILDSGFDVVVLSPGVPRTIELVKEAERRGIPVIAEIELAYHFIKGHIIAITGTDGKSTTTSLVGHILRSMGLRTFVGGNIGIPLISLVKDTDENSVSVIELSSFQLETIDRFRPHVSAILNVSPDHLDRYNGMDDYLTAKLRIAMNQGADDYYIYNRNDRMLSEKLDGIKARKLSFSLTDSGADAYYNDNSIFLRFPEGARKIIDTGRLSIMGIHNIENTMAALLMALSAARRMKIEPDMAQIEESCYSFRGLAHRMEYIGDYNGRKFINDSKATTVGAVLMALRSLDKKGILILGGRTKGDDYSRLAGSVKEKVRHLILIGESSGEFEKIFIEIPHSTAGSMDDAVAMAMKASGEGDVILLSPACASFDMFSSFEERGNVFRNSFEKLKRGELV